MCFCLLICKLYKFRAKGLRFARMVGWLVNLLVGFYVILSVVGYLLLNPLGLRVKKAKMSKNILIIVMPSV